MGIMEDNMSKAFDEACQALEVINRLIPMVEKLERENTELRAQTEAYLAAGVSWDGKWVNRDKERLDAYVKMVQEEFPFAPYYSDGCWRYPYLMGGEGGFGGGVAEKTFASFHEAIDAALKEPFI